MLTAVRLHGETCCQLPHQQSIAELHSSRGGKGPGEISQANPLLEQGQPEQVSQDHEQSLAQMQILDLTFLTAPVQGQQTSETAGGKHRPRSIHPALLHGQVNADPLALQLPWWQDHATEHILVGSISALAPAWCKQQV